MSPATLPKDQIEKKLAIWRANFYEQRFSGHGWEELNTRGPSFQEVRSRSITPLGDAECRY